MFTHWLSNRNLPSLGCAFALCCRFGVHAENPVKQQAEATQNAAESTTLEFGVPIERELAAGKKHSYQITLPRVVCYQSRNQAVSVEVRVSADSA
jgi:hypothetical protein